MFADFMRVVAKDCNFMQSRLSKADLREGDFANSNFNEANLYGANLERANMQFCTFTGTNLERANITNLRGDPDRIAVPIGGGGNGEINGINSTGIFGSEN